MKNIKKWLTLLLLAVLALTLTACGSNNDTSAPAAAPTEAPAAERTKPSLPVNEPR